MNDNDPNAAQGWQNPSVIDLANYHAPTRCAELTCLGCGFKDVYIYYQKIGTTNIKCRSCKNDNCMVEKWTK